MFGKFKQTIREQRPSATDIWALFPASFAFVCVKIGANPISWRCGIGPATFSATFKICRDTMALCYFLVWLGAAVPVLHLNIVKIVIPHLTPIKIGLTGVHCLGLAVSLPKKIFSRNSPVLFCMGGFPQSMLVSSIVCINSLIEFTLLMNVSGTLDPYQRIPRSPKKNPSDNNISDSERNRSPTASDQVSASHSHSTVFYNFFNWKRLRQNIIVCVPCTDFEIGFFRLAAEYSARIYIFSAILRLLRRLSGSI